jgi:hypothetical protein
MDRQAAISRLIDLELARVDTLISLVESAVAAEMEDLRDMAGDEDDGIESYADEAYELSDVGALFTQLSVIALYAVVEIRTKSLLAVKAAPADVHKAFKVKELKKLFKKHSGIALENVRDFATIDELRCLNNAIKHSGYVSDELGGFQGWTSGDRIGDVRPAVARIRPIVARYLADVAAALR